MDLSNLMPEEKDRLLAKLIEERQAGFSGDVSQIMDAVQYIAQRMDLLEKVVMDELIGGIKDLYKNNLRKKHMTSLEELYGGELEQFKEPYSEMMNGRGLLDDLLDQVDEMEEGWEDQENPFDRDASIMDIVGKLKDKMGKIMGLPGVEAASVTVDPEAAEAEMEDDEEDDMIKEIKRLSKKQKNY